MYYYATLQCRIVNFRRGRPREKSVIKGLRPGDESTQGIHINVCTYIHIYVEMYIHTYSTLHYTTIEYNRIQQNTLEYNRIQYNTIQCNTTHYTTLHDTTRHDKTRQDMHAYIHTYTNTGIFTNAAHLPQQVGVDNAGTA